MGSYSKMMPSLWTGATGRELRRCGRDAQLLACYLIGSPHANMLGLYYLPQVYIAHHLDMSIEAVERALQCLSRLGFAHYDEEAEVVWVVNMGRFQIAEELKPEDNRVRWAQGIYEDVPANAFLDPFYEMYGEAFRLTRRVLKGLRRGFEGASKGVRSQKLEHTQEQEQKPLAPTRQRAPDDAPEEKAGRARDDGRPTMKGAPPSGDGAGGGELSLAIQEAVRAMRVKRFHCLAVPCPENAAFWAEQLDFIEQAPGVTVFACLADVDAFYLKPENHRLWPRGQQWAARLMKSGLATAVAKLFKERQKGRKHARA